MILFHSIFTGWSFLVRWVGGRDCGKIGYEASVPTQTKECSYIFFGLRLNEILYCFYFSIHGVYSAWSHGMTQIHIFITCKLAFVFFHHQFPPLVLSWRFLSGVVSVPATSHCGWQYRQDTLRQMIECHWVLSLPISEMQWVLQRGQKAWR